MFVKQATRFECEIFVEKEGEEVNGKSIMGLMMLAAAFGTTLTIRAEGGDAGQAVDELEQLVQRNFEEESPYRPLLKGYSSYRPPGPF